MEIVDASLLIVLGAIISYLLDEIFGMTTWIRLWLEKL
jgi:F0F1-type ATP synthase assembly protein I